MKEICCKFKVGMPHVVGVVSRYIDFKDIQAVIVRRTARGKITTIALALMGDKYNSLLKYPHLASRLRNKVSPEEAFLPLRALLRRDELDSDARVALFGELAEPFKSLVEFPQESLDGLTDERNVRNVVDVIFHSRGAIKSVVP
jgi:hypothetical protein